MSIRFGGHVKDGRPSFQVFPPDGVGLPFCDESTVAVAAFSCSGVFEDRRVGRQKVKFYMRDTSEVRRSMNSV